MPREPQTPNGDGRSAMEKQLLDACKAAEAYLAFMERHAIFETDIGFDARPPLKTLRAAIAKVEGSNDS